MQDVKLVFYQALFGSALILAVSGLTALPPIKAVHSQWDWPLMAVIFLTGGLAAVAGLGVVFARSWIVYSLGAGLWAFGAMLLGAVLTSIFHAEATAKAGPAGMAFILPVIVYIFSLPAGLILRAVISVVQR
jgi:hypothetical protein